MSIQFFIFTITFAKKHKEHQTNRSPFYDVTPEEQLMDRKANFISEF